MFEFVFHIPYFQTLKRRQTECMMNRTRINSAQTIFFEISPLVKQYHLCQVPSRVREWCHDSAGDIDFYQMSLIQSESTCLHESVILQNIAHSKRHLSVLNSRFLCPNFERGSNIYNLFSLIFVC